MMQAKPVSNIPLSEPITEREREILALLAEHHTNKEIAASLHLALSTVKWYTRQIFGKLSVDNRREAVRRASDLGILGGEPKQTPNNLTSPATPFIGREEEVAQIVHLLTREDSRLITLHGPGGSGKTRLAIQAAENLLKSGSDLFPSGIWLVSLAKLQSPDSLVQTIASTTGCTFFDREREPLQQLLDYLRQRRMLLILDNIEHLLSDDSIHLVNEITSHAPDTRILITSRTRLNLQGEQVFPVIGMNIPKEENRLEENWASFSALQLFVACARRIQPKFEINEGNSVDVLRICQLVEGMPLGIEMATTWLELFTPQEIVAEMEQSFDFLRGQGTEKRHHNLRAVFNSSWKLLSHKEQNTLMALTVFHGSFTRGAAQSVSEAPSKTLLSLVHKSWLTKNADGRYHIHELLRQYAHGKLRADLSALEKAGNAHANYYATLMQDLEDQMKGFRQVEAFNLTELEFENIRTAWNWFIERGQSGLLIEKILLAFFLYCEARWRTWDTFPLIRQTREKLDDAKSNNENTLVDKAVLSLVELTFYTEFFHLRQIADFELWWGKALPLERVTFAWNVLANKSPKEVQGFWLILSTEFFAWHSLSQSSVQHLRRLIKTFTKRQDPWLRGIASQSLARVLSWFEVSRPQGKSNEKIPSQDGSRDEIRAALQEALYQFHATGDRLNQGNTLRMLADLEENPENEFSLLQKAKELLDAVGDLTTSTLILHNLAWLSIRQGKYMECFSYYHEEQKIFEYLGNQSLLANAYSWESLEALRFSTISHARQTRELNMAILRKELNALYSQRSSNPDRCEAMYAWAHWEMGEIERVAGNFEKARRNYKEAKHIFERQNIKMGIAFHHRGMGDLALADDDYNTARREFLLSIEISQAVPHPWMETCALCGLGRVAIRLNQYDAARENFLKALQISSQINNPELFMIGITGLASMFLRLGDPEQAVELSNFVLHHFASWNETKQQAQSVMDEATRQLPAEIVEASKERGKTLALEEIVGRFLVSR
jgi:predicted ATPase/DNA-binding CsgD family transcriptional regulator